MISHQLLAPLVVKVGVPSPTLASPHCQLLPWAMLPPLAGQRAPEGPQGPPRTRSGAAAAVAVSAWRGDGCGSV